MILVMPVQRKPTSVFGAQLIALRKARGMTQSQLAQAIGVNQSTVSYHEAIADMPAGEIVVKLAQVLGVTTDELLGAKPPPRIDSPTADPGARRYWRRFQQLMQLPEKDQRAVFRTLDTMTKASKAGKSKTSQA